MLVMIIALIFGGIFALCMAIEGILPNIAAGSPTALPSR